MAKTVVTLHHELFWQGPVWQLGRLARKVLKESWSGFHTHQLVFVTAGTKVLAQQQGLMKKFYVEEVNIDSTMVLLIGQDFSRASVRMDSNHFFTNLSDRDTKVTKHFL